MKKLTKETIECLHDRLSQIKSNIVEEGKNYGEEAKAECAESWKATLEELAELIADPTQELLSKLDAAAEELELYEEGYTGVRRDLRAARRIEEKRDWDAFIAAGGDPDSVIVFTCRFAR
jgi:uncharacterized protein YycO